MRRLFLLSVFTGLAAACGGGGGGGSDNPGVPFKYGAATSPSTGETTAASDLGSTLMASGSAVTTGSLSKLMLAEYKMTTELGWALPALAKPPAQPALLSPEPMEVSTCGISGSYDLEGSEDTGSVVYTNCKFWDANDNITLLNTKSRGWWSGMLTNHSTESWNGSGTVWEYNADHDPTGVVVNVAATGVLSFDKTIAGGAVTSMTISGTHAEEVSGTLFDFTIQVQEWDLTLSPTCASQITHGKLTVQWLWKKPVPSKTYQDFSLIMYFTGCDQVTVQRATYP
jgi:hypothetical protein